MFRALCSLCAAAVLTASACAPAEPAADAETAVPVVYAPANRPDVRGTRGAVSAGHPLAAQAGLDVLKSGGNAVDAALAMAAVLAVVRPHMNGVGGDAFVFVHEAASGEVHALNGSGRAGALATPAFFTDAGFDAVPERGAASVSVPGAVAAWVDVHERFGTRPFAELLQPAIGYARDGFPVSTRLASDIASQGDALEADGAALYMPDGAPPAVGSLLRNPALAATLERIARDGKAGFYQGPVAERLAAVIEAGGGHVRAADLAAHTSTWVEPLRTEYLGHEFLVFPPNTQGIAQLQYFDMAEAHDVRGMGWNTAPYLHTLIELKKLAFADRDRWVGDPDHVEIPVRDLLDPDYLSRRAGLIDAGRAAEGVESGVGDPLPEAPETDDGGDTVYLTAVDADGNAVSWIQSLYAGFGSGILDPETGVVLHNRGALYRLQEGHPNQVAPGTRPYHTLTPMMALRDGRFAFTMGTPGGDSQPQSLIQIVNNLLMFGMTPQEAIEAPRFRSYDDLGVAVEDRVHPTVRAALEALGHEIRVIEGWTSTFGGAQMIMVDPTSGTLVVGSDPRREAYGLAY
ncbi:MAG: gamma-glutamyltransferase [Longimicrobiales bacterium]